MRDFATACPVIELTSSREQRPKGAQFLRSCHLCQQSHTTQAWLCFFVLSFLSTCTCATSGSNAAEASICLNNLSDIIKKSNALLYAPSINDIEKNCKIASFNCYMLELEVIFFEEEIVESEDADCIFHFRETLSSETNSASCRPCEAYALENTTVFFDRLKVLLEVLTVQWKT